MQCPNCKSLNIALVRFEAKTKNTRRRIIKCEKCGTTFNTIEIIGQEFEMYVQRNDEKVYYKRAIFMASLGDSYSFNVTKRGILKNLAQRIEDVICDNGGVISSKNLEKYAVDMFLENELYESALRYISAYCPERLTTDFKDLIINLENKYNK